MIWEKRHIKILFKAISGNSDVLRLVKYMQPHIAGTGERISCGFLQADSAVRTMTSKS